MLIEINLAPGRSGRSRARALPALSMPNLPSFGADRRVTAVAALALLIVGLLGFMVWRLGARSTAVAAQIEREVADSTRYATTIALVESLRARQDTITQKIDVIRGVDNRRYVWPHLLDEISVAIPAFLWLTEIGSTEAADSMQIGPSFSLQGNAGSTQALTRFMKNLEESDFVRDVTLITSEQDIVEGRTIQRFSLEARYSVPPSSVIRTVPIVVLEH